MDLSKQKQIVTELYNSRNNDFGQNSVVINCMNGTANAHKAVLKLGSQYFNDMFSSNNEENRTNVVNFPETPVETVDIILRYLYGQSSLDLSQLSEELSRDLILEADKLQLTELFDKCWNALNSSITPKNCFYVWELSCTLNKSKCLGNVMTFLERNLSEIAESEEFLNKDAKQLLNLIRPDLVKELNGMQMTGLFKFILSWGSQTQRMEDVHTLLSNCDLKKLPDEYLSSVMEKDLSRQIRNMFNNEVIKRWMKSIKPQYFIHEVRINGKGSCVRQTFSSRHNNWLGVKQCESDIKTELITKNGGNKYQWLRFCRCEDIPMAIQLWCSDNLTTAVTCGDSDDGSDERVTTTCYKTANSTHNYFKLIDNVGYVSLSDRGITKIFSKQFYGNCKRLLLVVGSKFYFDADIYSIKIHDWDANVSKTIEKPPGNWKSFSCPSKLFETSGISGVNIFFYNKSNKLLLFDVENEKWLEDELSISPNIDLEQAKFVSYDKAFIALSSIRMFQRVLLYSLKENCEIVKTDGVMFDNYFYVSLDDGSS